MASVSTPITNGIQRKFYNKLFKDKQSVFNTESKAKVSKNIAWHTMFLIYE